MHSSGYGILVELWLSLLVQRALLKNGYRRDPLVVHQGKA